ncbi:MAG: alpha/beta fold hydrolase [Candidatus Nanopelagicaceae bacterium]
MITREYGRAQSTSDPLLFIHGMGSAATAWKPLIQALHSEYRCITIDLPGHGESPLLPHQAMDPFSLGVAIFDIMEKKEIKRFHIVSNSWGGWISLEMAALQPERVSSVTALAPAGLWLTPYTNRKPATAFSRTLAKLVNPVAPFAVHFERARGWGFSDVSPRWRTLSHEVCLDATKAMAKSPGYFPAWDAMLKKRFHANIPESVPITIMFGDSDNTLPADTCQERSLAPRHAKWLILPNGGHAPMWDHVDDVVAVIRDNSSVAR